MQVDRLIAQGHTVIVRDQFEVGIGDAAGKDLIVISDSISSGNVGDTFTNVALPVVTWESGLYDDMQLTGTVVGVDYNYINAQTQLDIVDSSHPLAGGLTTGVTTVMDASSRFFWGAPAADAVTVATIVGAPGSSAIFAYDTGDGMVGMTAPARRVAFFNGDGLDYNAQAWQLYDAAITWGLGCESVSLSAPAVDRWSLFMASLWTAVDN